MVNETYEHGRGTCFSSAYGGKVKLVGSTGADILENRELPQRHPVLLPSTSPARGQTARKHPGQHRGPGTSTGGEAGGSGKDSKVGNDVVLISIKGNPATAST